MSRFLPLFAAILLLVGCSKDRVSETNTAKVHVTFDAFSVSQGEFDSKATIADYNNIKYVVLAFYKSDGSQQYKSIQYRNDPTTYDTVFGDFDLTLPMGSYTMVAFGYSTIDGSPFELTSTTLASYTGEHALETFSVTQAVNITNTNDVTLNAALDRIVSKLQVISTDGRTANASNIQMTISGGSRSFNPTTGLASDNNGFVNTVGISASEGDPSTSTTYLFVYSDPQTVTVTIDVLNSDGQSISQKVVNNVPLQRNRVTKLTGPLYTSGAGTGFTVNTTWLSDTTITF